MAAASSARMKDTTSCGSRSEYLEDLIAKLELFCEGQKEETV